jgi:hypothetical protein
VRKPCNVCAATAIIGVLRLRGCFASRSIPSAQDDRGLVVSSQLQQDSYFAFADFFFTVAPNGPAVVNFFRIAPFIIF